MQTRSVAGGDFFCKTQLETPLRCKLQEKIASCDMALRDVKFLKSCACYSSMHDGECFISNYMYSFVSLIFCEPDLWLM